VTLSFIYDAYYLTYLSGKGLFPLENKLEFQERIRAHYWSLEKDGLTLGNDEKRLQTPLML
jgi:hypothetical protein